MTADYFVGLDLGQSQDYTALVVAERLKVPTSQLVMVSDGLEVDTQGRWMKVIEHEEPVTIHHYHLRHLQRFALGTPYPAIVVAVAALLARDPLNGHATLAIDATGVGPPVVDMLRRAQLRSRLSAITITGGDTVTREGDRCHVPKRDLVSTVQVLLQGGRLKIAPSLPEAAVLVQELQSFQVKITISANDTYGAWREGSHDDLVLATAMACWQGESERRWGVL